MAETAVMTATGAVAWGDGGDGHDGSRGMGKTVMMAATGAAA